MSIYLMRDKASGFYKIGQSKQVGQREATLGAQFPSLETVRVWETDKSDHDLHWKFRHKRLRGEWFDLTAADIERIDGYLAYPIERKPRVKGFRKLSVDDLNRIVTGTKVDGDVLLRLQDWAKGELHRRELCGLRGGRPKQRI
jgi:hypothetical protein